MLKRPAKNPAKKAANLPAELRDGGEDASRMEPMVITSENAARRDLEEKAIELVKRSTNLHAGLPPGLRQPLVEFIRSMNCYYSNLIEGHDTHPVDIERALNGEYSAEPKKRNLQLEAKAHIAVQRWIDEGGLEERETQVSGILELHRRFTDLLPAELRWVENPETKERIEVRPGEFRVRDAKVGRHIAISPGAVPRFMLQFEARYSRLTSLEAIVSSGASHHRLLYIHPFADGNGRVTRLMSYAVLRRVVGTGGLWSIARGLARNEATYKQHLASCDDPRQGDRDGRGNLSEAALSGFCTFFLDVCLDQVAFMASVMQPKLLGDRIGAWAEEEARLGQLPQQAGRLLAAILFQGAVARADVPGIIDKSERSARDLTKALSRTGIIASDTAKGPWRLAFPAALAPRLTPGLFPDRK